MTHKEVEPQVYKAIIVDDEPHAVDQVRKLLAEEKRIEVVAGMTNPGEALQKITAVRPDLLFLDIQMPGMNGFELVARLKEAGVHPAVIFVTAYDRFAIDAIRSSAFDLLLKPIDRKEFEMCLERYFADREKHRLETRYLELLKAVNPNQKVRFNTAGGFVVLNMNDILYIQADWNYSKVYLSADKTESLTMNLGAVEKRLPMTKFMRINRSVIVNLHYLKRVKRVARECVLEKDGREYSFPIPVVRIRQLEKLL
jgi:two-component system, LytTR family, response regulator